MLLDWKRYGRLDSLYIPLMSPLAGDVIRLETFRWRRLSLATQ